MSRFLSWRAPMVVGVLGLLALGLIGYGAFAPSQAESLEVFGDAPAFALTDHLERPVSSDDLRGKVVVANFIYTSCQDTCPLLSAQMKSLQERLRREGMLGDQVQLVSFSVDPKRDTPPVLRAYAERLQADPQAWRFLTGSEDYVEPLIIKGFRLGAQPVPAEEATPHAHDGKESAKPYEVMHSNRFVLIDREWRIRAYYDGLELDLDRVVGDARQLLR